MGLHDGGEVVHLTMVLRVIWILAGRIKAVNLLFQTFVRLRMGRKAEEDACERD